MKRRIRQRPQRNRDNVFYTFHSYGTYHRFNPNRLIEDDRVINEANWFERMTMLEMYKDEVRMANASHVYILDNKGEVVPV
jgi:hypothetical protein